MSKQVTRDENRSEFDDDFAKNDSNKAFDRDDKSKIVDFFKGRGVFITGASGFIGKVLIEKILRCCVGVEKVYLLLRNKKGQNPKQRLEGLLNSKLFERVRKELGNGVFDKLVVVNGDLTQLGLGISETDLENMIRDVSVVFHSAATIKFNEPLRVAVNLNVLGTRRIIELCQKLPLLEALVHVSTAYANCDRQEVEEVIYPMHFTPQTIIDTVEWMNDDLLDSITPQLLGNRPNTYTFSKALAENLLADEAVGLPVAIIRPSIVTAAWKEPYPGWIDNVNGPSGMLTALYKGVLKSMMIDANKDADIIPVDVTTNLMLTVAWRTATRKPNNLMVYNCVSGCVKPSRWGHFIEYSLPIMRKYPSERIYRCPSLSLNTNRLIHNIAIIYHHYLPAAAIDCVRWAQGKKPKMVKMYQRIHKELDSLEHFTSNQWKFYFKNVLALNEELNQADKDIFGFDLTDLSISDYLKNYILGIRHFILKEDNSTIPVARNNLQRMIWNNKITNFVIIVTLWIFLATSSKMVQAVTWFPINSLIKIYSAISFESLSSSNLRSWI